MITSSRPNKNRELFRELNAKLVRLDPSLGTNIVCPLCLKSYSLDSLQSELSVEHVPPTKAATLIKEKRFKTLTCRRCNNTYGSQYQADLKHFLRHQLFENGKYNGQIRGTVTFLDNPPLQCNIDWTPGNLKIIGVPKANNPATTDQHVCTLEELSRERRTDWKFSLTGNFEYRLNVAWFAYLQIAYLLAYILTDCSYAFSKAGTVLRGLFTRGVTQEVKPCVIPPQRIGVGGIPWMACVTEPSNLRCLWVKVAGNIVVLPLPTDDELHCYEAWRKVSAQTHFGLSPQSAEIHISFSSEQDFHEAQKCLPDFFSSASPLSSKRPPIGQPK